MLNVPVFAGLGSPALFSEQTQSTALIDAATPEARLLLDVCHKIFRIEIATVDEEDGVSVEVDLRDFQEPESLLKPLPRYMRNAVIQNTTLCLVQLLRYLAHNDSPSSTGGPSSLGVAGFCAGLLTSAAVATSSGTLQYLAHSQTSFTLALLLGIRCEQEKQRAIASDPIDPDCPWSLVVDGLACEEAEHLLADYKNETQGSHIYVSAINAERCVTLSGKGDVLRAFADTELKNCKVRPTSIYSSYHDSRALLAVKSQLIRDFADRGISFPSISDLNVPIYSTKDGAHIRPGDGDSNGNLLEQILNMILIHPANWMSVQQNLFDSIEELKSAEDPSVNILNFGPAYGISKNKKHMPNNAHVIDASASSDPHKPSQAPSCEDDVAIVGMAVDLPGAPDTAHLWKVLSEGINTVSEIPESRFHVEDFTQHDGTTPPNPKRSMGTKFGNFVDNPFKFDPAFFGISPREARSIDPQQRLLLQTTLKALEDAGYVPDATPSFMRKTFGCYVGNATLDYPANLKDDIDVYYSPGTLRAFLSGRISYAFKLSGPSSTIDTACSSSMIAILQACRALAAGDCRAVIAGGVNMITSPDMYLGLDRAHFLSPTGQCKPFDASADGYCRSEGCGVFILKKMSDALREDDQILGVIKGIAANQSGNAHSITHPHAPTQEELFHTLLSKTRIDPLHISVVESHGTGTQAGDPNELESIRNVLCKDRNEQIPLHITSIKANIGHCEAASGAAALAKLVLMLHHDNIPPLISLKNLNPRIAPLKVDGAFIDREGSSWPRRKGQPRLALLNNFGAAGSNSALILQEYVNSTSTKSEGFQERATYPFGCSAKSESALLNLRDSILSYLRNNSSTLRLADVCYTSTARRQVYQKQVSVCASSIQELIDNLEKADPVSVPSVIDPPPAVTFLFSGQGRQYLAMGQELYLSSPNFRATVLECHRLLIESGFPGCLDIINPSNPPVTSLTDDLRLQAFQASIFVLEVGLARLWLSWGVVPSVVTGHSIGEYAALAVAGVLSLADGLKIVAYRARLMMTLCQSGMTGLLAANIGAAQLDKILQADSAYEGLSIACYNSAQDCVVGGPVLALQTLKEDLITNQQRKSTMLKVPLAYHTKAMEPILAPLAEVARQMDISAPNIAVASSVLGRVVPKGEDAFTPEYFVHHCRQAVVFEQGIEDLITKGPTQPVSNGIWIEIGPHPSLLPMVRSKIQHTAVSIPSMREGTPPWVTLSQALSRLYISKSKVKWRNVFEGSLKPQCVAFPVYPLEGAKFYVGYPHESGSAATDSSNTSQKASTGYSFLSSCVELPSVENGQRGVWDTPIDVLAEYVSGHIVCGHALCPASIYHEMALSASKHLRETSHNTVKGPAAIDTLSNVSYVHPLLYDAGSKKIVRVSIKTSIATEKDIKFSISSYEQSATKTATIHCQGLIKRRSETAINQQFARLRPVVKRKKAHFDKEFNGTTLEVFRTSAMYEKLFTRVVTYSDLYQAVRSISVDVDGTEGFATAQIPLLPVQEKKTFAINPVFGDVLLHVAGFVANLSVKNDDACICKEVKSMRILTNNVDFGTVFEVHCSNLYLPEEDSVIADAHAVDLQGRVIAVFKGMHFMRIKLSKVDTMFRLASRTDSSQQSRAGNRSHQQQINSSKSNPADVSSAKNEVALHERAIAPIKSSQEQGLQVGSIIASTCGVDPATISGDTDLEGLGIDSLMIHELDARLKGSSGVDFQSSDLAACKTVRDVERVAGAANNPKLDTAAPVVASKAPAPASNQGVSPMAVASIIAETCGSEQDQVTEDTELEAIGVDSLMISELESRLRDILEVDFESSELASCKYVGDVVRLVNVNDNSGQENAGQNESESDHEDNQQPNGTTSTAGLSDTSEETLNSVILSAQSATPITPADEEALPTLTKDLKHALKLDQLPELIQSENTDVEPSTKAFPLFLIHDGSGLCVKYHKLQPLRRQVWGMHNPKFASEEVWEGPTSMASNYAAHIASTTSGPVILGGWSFGGVLAFETAKILLQQNFPLAGVILIDSPAPLNHQPLSPEIIAAVTKPPSTSPSAKIVRSLVRRQFRLATGFMKDFPPPPSVSSMTVPQLQPKIILLRSREGFDASGVGGPRHAWLEDRKDARMAVEGWETIIGAEVSLVDIEGNHFEPFEEKNIWSVSEAVGEACRGLEKAFRGL